MAVSGCHLVAVLAVFYCLVASSDGDCRWQWSEWTSCNPGFFSNLLFKRDRTRLMLEAPVLSRGDRCDFSLNLNSPELVSDSGNGLVQSQPCSTRDTATYNGFCVDASMARCANGFCISKDLFCNQDDDCQDRSDESNCTKGMRWCNGPDERRPSHNEWSLGVDLLSGHPRHHVLETGFNGECKSMTDGDQRMYRQPYNVLHVSSIIPAKEHILVKTFTDYADFMKYIKQHVKHVSQRASIGYSFFPSNGYKSLYVFVRLTIVSETVDLKYESSLKPSKEMYQDLHNLPADVNNEVYMNFINKYGTHFMSQSNHGGSLLTALAFDRCLIDTAREHIELDLAKFLTELNPATTLQKRVTEYFKNVTHEYVHITGGHVPHNLLTGSGYSVRHMNLTDIRQWKRSIELSPQILPTDALESEEPVLTDITKLFHQDLLTVRRWDRVRTNLEMMIYRYLSIYDDTGNLCPDCDGDDVILTPDVYYPAPSRFGCLCVTRDQRRTPICYPRTEMVKEDPLIKRTPGMLDQWAIIALTLICLALVGALAYIALSIRGKQKEQGCNLHTCLPWTYAKSPQVLSNEHKKLSIAPKVVKDHPPPGMKNNLTSPRKSNNDYNNYGTGTKPYTKDNPKKALMSANSFIFPDEKWHVDLESDSVGDITFVAKTSEIQLAMSYPYKNKVVIFSKTGVLERDTESYNITLDIPQGIIYHRDVEKIVVCEWGAKCVSVLPTTLDAKFRSFVVPSRPWSICPLVDNRLAIGTCEKGPVSSIYIYTITGVIQNKFQIGDCDRPYSMEEFGEEHLLVVNWDGKKSNHEMKNGKSPLKRTKSRRSQRKPSDSNDRNENKPLDDKNTSSPLIPTPVYSTVQKKGLNRGESTRSAATPYTPDSHRDDNAKDMQLAVYDKSGQYQWNFREPNDINPDLQVTSVCVSRLPISNPSWQNPDFADIQVLVSFATNSPGLMLQAYSPEGHALKNIKFSFKYENSYGTLRSVSYEQDLIALLFEKHLAVYEGAKMLSTVL